MTQLMTRNQLRIQAIYAHIALDEYRAIPEQFRNPDKERQMVETIDQLEREIAGIPVG